MIFKRREPWGEMNYDSESQSFRVLTSSSFISEPYPKAPLVLNVDLTFKCNMVCSHCVAKDMEKKLGEANKTDLVISDSLLKDINNSPFMVIVITGGEPLLPQYQNNLDRLITSIKNKALIIDTNGTIIPSLNMLRKFRSKRVLIRVSWDIPHPSIESILRKYPDIMYKNDLDYVASKQRVIKIIQENNIDVAVQSVIHRYNCNNNNLFSFPYKLQQLNLKHWYIQRFIPSHHKKNENMPLQKYEIVVHKLQIIARKLGVRCHFKRDKRHNSVYLLVKEGELYTQSDEKPGDKVYLGKIGRAEYFMFVSAPDHSARYVIEP